MDQVNDQMIRLRIHEYMNIIILFKLQYLPQIIEWIKTTVIKMNKNHKVLFFILFS